MLLQRTQGLEKVVQSEHEWEFANGDFVRGHPERLKNINDIYRARLESLYDLHVKPITDRMRSYCRAGGNVVTYILDGAKGGKVQGVEGGNGKRSFISI